jgi:hypothetical protein
MRKLTQIICVIISLLYFPNLYGQGWDNEIVIHEEPNLKVVVQVKNRLNSCSPNQKPNRFRYKITGTGGTTQKIKWFLSYRNCSGIETNQQVSYNVPYNYTEDVWIEDQDFSFVCQKFNGITNNRISTSNLATSHNIDKQNTVNILNNTVIDVVIGTKLSIGDLNNLYPTSSIQSKVGNTYAQFISTINNYYYKNNLNTFNKAEIEYYTVLVSYIFLISKQRNSNNANQFIGLDTTIITQLHKVNFLDSTKKHINYLQDFKVNGKYKIENIINSTFINKTNQIKDELTKKIFEGFDNYFTEFERVKYKNKRDPIMKQFRTELTIANLSDILVKDGSKYNKAKYEASMLATLDIIKDSLITQAETKKINELSKNFLVTIQNYSSLLNANDIKSMTNKMSLLIKFSNQSLFKDSFLSELNAFVNYKTIKDKSKAGEYKARSDKFNKILAKNILEIDSLPFVIQNPNPNVEHWEIKGTKKEYSNGDFKFSYISDYTSKLFSFKLGKYDELESGQEGAIRTILREEQIKVYYKKDKKITQSAFRTVIDSIIITGLTDSTIFKDGHKFNINMQEYKNYQVTYISDSLSKNILQFNSINKSKQTLEKNNYLAFLRGINIHIVMVRNYQNVLPTNVVYHYMQSNNNDNAADRGVKVVIKFKLVQG